MEFKFTEEVVVNLAYELRKNFPLEETPVMHFICDNEAIVLSSKKLYIFYYNSYVDFVGEVLPKVSISDLDIEKASCNIKLGKRIFNLKLLTKSECEMFIRFFNKYRKAYKK